MLNGFEVDDQTLENEVTGEDVLTTSDAVDNVIHTFDTAADSIYAYEVYVVGVSVGAAKRAVYHLKGVFYNAGAGAVQQGLTTSVTTIESDAAWYCGFSVNADSIRVSVNSTGETAGWSVSYKRYVKTFA
jgi:hypothetical protein